MLVDTKAAPWTERLAVTAGFTLANAPYKKLNSSDPTIVLEELKVLCQNDNQERRSVLFSSGQEEAYLAFKLLRNLTTSGHQAIRDGSTRLLELYLTDARFITPLTHGDATEAPARKKNALRNIFQYLNATSQEAKDEALKNITKATGFFFTEVGDDNLKKTGVHDDRLLNYFQNLSKGKDTLANKIVFDLLMNSDFCQQSAALRANPPEWATKDPRISLSLAQVDKANSNIKSNGSAKIGFLTYANVVECDSTKPAEKEFLKELAFPGIDPENFKLDFNQIVDALNCTSTASRSGDNNIQYSKENVVDHLSAAYLLLQFRIRTLEEGGYSSTSPEVKAINKQIARLQTTVNEVYALDSNGTIHSKLEKEISDRLPTCFLYSMQGATKIAEATMGPAADRIIAKAKTEYGAAIPAVIPPAVATTGVKGLRDIDKAVQNESRKLSRTLSDNLTAAISPDQVFVDYNNLKAFKQVIEDWKADMKDLTNPSSVPAMTEFARRAALAGGGLGTPAPVIDMEKATTSLKAHLTTLAPSSPAVQYVIDNWDKLYNVSFSSFTMQPTDAYENKNLPSTEEALTAHILSSLATREKEVQGSAIEVHLKSDTYNENIGELFSGHNDGNYDVTKLIRDQLLEVRKKDELIYERLDRNGSALTSLLTAKDETLVKETATDTREGSNTDIRSRLCGVMILGQKIANSSADATTKEAALRRIGRTLLGLDTAGTTQFIAALSSSAPILNRACSNSLKTTMDANKAAVVEDAATLLQYQVMTIDIHEKGVLELDKKINTENKKIIQGYAKLMFGSELDFLHSHITALAERCTPKVIENIQAAHDKMKACTNSEDKLQAQAEFFHHLSGAFGHDFIKKFTNNDILDDQLLNSFMSNSIFTSRSNGTDGGFLKFFIDLWRFVTEELLSTSNDKPQRAQPPERNYNRSVATAAI